jgi:hypothetical protein
MRGMCRHIPIDFVDASISATSRCDPHDKRVRFCNVANAAPRANARGPAWAIIATGTKISVSLSGEDIAACIWPTAPDRFALGGQERSAVRCRRPTKDMGLFGNADLCRHGHRDPVQRLNLKQPNPTSTAR